VLCPAGSVSVPKKKAGSICATLNTSEKVGRAYPSDPIIPPRRELWVSLFSARRKERVPRFLFSAAKQDASCLWSSKSEVFA
jgi:hypothetical protein